MNEFEGKVALVTGGSSGISRMTAIAFGQKGINVVLASRRVTESNAICPAGTDTDMQRRLAKSFEVPYEDWKKEMGAKHPIGGFSDPEEVAKIVLWLCLDAPSSVTGSSVVIDGGWTAQ